MPRLFIYQIQHHYFPRTKITSTQLIKGLLIFVGGLYQGEITFAYSGKLGA